MKKNFTLFAILIVFINSIAFSQSITLGLVGDYPFTGNALDNSGFGNNAIVWGAVPIAGEAGIPNTAFHFDGISNYMEVADANSLDLDTAITINVVFKSEGFYTGPCQNNTMLTKWSTFNNGTGYAASFTDNVVDYNCNLIDTTKVVFLGVSSNNNWNQGLYDYHEYIQSNIWYCGTFTQSLDTQKIYLNGVLKSSHYVPNNIGINSAPIWFGKGSTGIPSFKGIIDDIKLYNRALSAIEVANLCSQTATSISEYNNDANFNVSPNPSKGISTFNSLGLKGNVNCQVYDSYGRLLQELNFTNKNNNTIDLSKEMNGVYFVKVVSDKNNLVKKIIKN